MQKPGRAAGWLRHVRLLIELAVVILVAFWSCTSFAQTLVEIRPITAGSASGAMTSPQSMVDGKLSMGFLFYTKSTFYWRYWHNSIPFLVHFAEGVFVGIFFRFSLPVTLWVALGIGVWVALLGGLVHYSAWKWGLSSDLGGVEGAALTVYVNLFIAVPLTIVGGLIARAGCRMFASEK
jgi:hypothetical protein